MRTTVILDEDTYRAAKATAARQGSSLGSVIETALREYLDRVSAPADQLPDLPTFPGGPAPGIDIDRTSALLDDLDADDRTHAQR